MALRLGNYDFRTNPTDVVGRYARGAQMRNQLDAQRQATLQKQQQMQQQEQLFNIVNGLGPDSSYEDWSMAMNKVMALGGSKDMADSMGAAYDVLKEGREDSSVGILGGVYNALAMGENQIAHDNLMEYSQALRNQGQTQLSNMYGVLAQKALEDPEAALKSVGMNLVPLAGGKEIMDNVLAQREEDRLQAKDDRDAAAWAQEQAIAITDAGSRVDATAEELVNMRAIAERDPDFAAELTKVLNFASASDEGITFSPAERFRLEQDLAKRWVNETKTYRAAKLSNSQVQDAFSTAFSTDGGGSGYVDAEGNPVTANTQGAIPVAGIADLTLINLFQRQIDDATVRESDIDNILTTIGGKSRLDQWFTNLMKGEKLNNAQRRQISEMSQMLFDAQQDLIDKEVFPAIQQAQELNSFDYKTVFGNYVPPEERGVYTSSSGQPATGIGAGIAGQSGVGMSGLGNINPAAPAQETARTQTTVQDLTQGSGTNQAGGGGTRRMTPPDE